MTSATTTITATSALDTPPRSDEFADEAAGDEEDAALGPLAGALVGAGVVELEDVPKSRANRS
jgi:hypothetical protein